MSDGGSLKVDTEGFSLGLSVSSEARNLVIFSKCCQWPMKQWYKDTLSAMLMRLRAKGMVEAVVGVGAVKSVSNKFVSDVWYVRDTGPDEYAIAYAMLKTDHTAEELNEFVGTDAFRSSNDVCVPTWDDIAEKQLVRFEHSRKVTLVDLLDGKEGRGS